MYEQIVSHLDRDLEFNAFEAPDELQINTVTQQIKKQTLKNPNQFATIAKSQVTIEISAVNSNEKKDQVRNNMNNADNNNNNIGSGQTSSNSNNTFSNNTNANNTNNQKDRRHRPVYPPCETCGKTYHSTEKCYFGANAANRPPPRNRRPEGQNQIQQRNAQSNSDGNFQAATQILNYKSHVFTPDLHVRDRR